VLAECLNEAELSPSDLMKVDFGKPHLTKLGEPGSMLSEIRRYKDGLPNPFAVHKPGDRVEVLWPSNIPVHLSACRV
jgi:hypothetical protein